MKKAYARLQRIEGNHIITADSDGAFLYQLQNALLLALEEQKILNTVQYHYAQDALRKGYHKQFNVTRQ